MATNLSIKIDLLKLSGACIHNLAGRNGITKRCLIVPVDDNSCMHVGEKGCYLDMIAFERGESRYGDTHFIKPDYPREVRERMTEEDRNRVPILGNIRPIVKQEQKSNESGQR